MGYLSFGWGAGTIVGPVAGGFLALPCDKYTSFFGPFCHPASILRHFPYLLPCLLAAMASMSSFVVVTAVLRETLAPERRISLCGPWAPAGGRRSGLGVTEAELTELVTLKDDGPGGDDRRDTETSSLLPRGSQPEDSFAVGVESEAILNEPAAVVTRQGVSTCMSSSSSDHDVGSSANASSVADRAGEQQMAKESASTPTHAAADPASLLGHARQEETSSLDDGRWWKDRCAWQAASFSQC